MMQQTQHTVDCAGSATAGLTTGLMAGRTLSSSKGAGAVWGAGEELSPVFIAFQVFGPERHDVLERLRCILPMPHDASELCCRKD